LAGEEGKKAEPAIVVGHDWGSFIAQRFALWYPELIKALCIVCVPWTAVTHQQVSIDDVIKKLPNFAYQKQFASGDVEKRIAEVGERGLENFVLFGAGGMTEERKPLFNPRTGIDLKALGGKIHPTLYNDKDELAYVTEEYKRHGAHPPLNAYRVMPMNVEDEKALPKSTDTKIEIRTLFIRALQDEALPPYMSTGMENYFADGALTIKDIDANHFVMLEAPDKFNNTLKEWLVGLSGVGSRTKAAL
jgi:soluble epoxide hydrolase/lipid-phosphate phosphatase